MKFLGVPSSGSMAGTTWSHNRAGQYTRNRRSPVQPVGSGRRAFIRAAFGSQSKAWGSLDIPTQAAWAGYANEYPRTDALGQTILLTGSQMYVAINTQLLNCLSTTTTTPPASNTTQNLTGVAVNYGTIVAPTMTVTWDTGSADDFVLIAASQQFGGGKSFCKTFWQADVQAASSGTDDIRSIYEAQFGATVVGARIFVKLTPVNKYGVTGTPVILTTTVSRV